MQYKQDALLILDLAKKYLEERKSKLVKEVEEKLSSEVEEGPATPGGEEISLGNTYDMATQVAEISHI